MKNGRLGTFNSFLIFKIMKNDFHPERIITFLFYQGLVYTAKIFVLF